LGEGIASVLSDDTDLFQLKANWDVGKVSLVSNSSYVDRHIQSTDDGTAFILDIYQSVFGVGALAPLFNGLIIPLAGGSGPINFELSMPGIPGSPGGRCGECFLIDLDMTQEGWTQEFRLQSNDADARLQWVTGAFFQHTEQMSHEWDRAPWAPDGGYLGTGSPIARAIFGSVLLPVGPDGLVADALSEIVDDQYAVFGQADYHLNDKWTLTAGARYSVLEFESQATGVDVSTGIETVAPVRKSKEEPLTPKLGVQYQTSEEVMFYASAAEGFRSGGVNTASEGTPDPACQAGLALIGYTEIPATYESDSTWNYEIGAKGNVGNWAFAADVFYTEWDDVQRSRAIPGCINIFTDNLGKAISQGVEANITVTPADGLTLNAAVAYVDATQDETLYVPGTENTIIRKGDRFATPWTVNLTGDYETPINWEDSRVYGTVQYTYRSEWDAKPGNVAANPVLFNTDDQNQLNIRLGIRRAGFDVSAFVNNVTNSRDVIGRLHFQPSERIAIQTWRPRTYGVTFRYNF
jgi:iron complex outermembrane receptor protein